MLGHRVPGHVGPFDDSAVIRLIGAKPHVLPDLPLLLGEFLQRWEPPQPVLDGLPLRVQLLDEHLQFLLAFLTGVGVDAFGVLGAVARSLVSAAPKMAGDTHKGAKDSERYSFCRLSRSLLPSW